VASWKPPENGYATAAFGAVALGLAIIAATLLAFANTELRAARKGERAAIEGARLEGGLVIAADVVMREARSGPLAWSADVDGRTIRFLAEPEAGKIGGRHIDGLDPKLLQRLAADLKTGPGGLQGSDLHASRNALYRASDSPNWKRCAASYVSPLSDAREAAITAPAAPAGGAINWRVGEVWRLVAYEEGKAADALVRFTGDPAAPMAILDLRVASMNDLDAAACYQLSLEDGAP
jgi:hypothetical protein